MLGRETRNWLHNGSNAPNGQADLGYFMGYVICKSYYSNARNKKNAFKRIVELEYDKKSAMEFLKQSKYMVKEKNKG
jgi:hypothetical protein